jgi:predicted secreted protein
MKDIDFKQEECCVSCETCTKYEYVAGTNYKEINNELRSLGWTTKNIDGKWCDFCCLSCYEKYIKTVKQ